MKPNVIILTGGLSGSSVIAGLISLKGYWLGEDTKEIRYQTYENSRLVDLNVDLLRKSGYSWDDVMEIPPPSNERMNNIAYEHDISKFQDFIHDCNEHTPWLWKDPRLCYTIRFWEKFLDLEKCKFILMSRDIQQAWSGIILKGKMPITYDHLRTVEQNCIAYSKKFLLSKKIPFLELTFEGLMLKPEQTIEQVNQFLQMKLNLSDLTSIYKGPLYKKRWSLIDYHKAKMKFAFYKYIKRDIIQFPRKKEGRGSGWYHLKKVNL